MNDVPEFVFVVDTTEYVGSFERELRAYVTGQYGECEVGEELAKLAEKELTDNQLEYFSENINQVADEEAGCHWLVSIWPTPGYSNNGVGNIIKLKEGEEPVFEAYNSVAIFFYKQPTEDAIQLMKERVDKYLNLPNHIRLVGRIQKFKVLGYRLLQQKVVTTELLSLGVHKNVY